MDKRSLTPPTDEEDAAINCGIALDPDPVEWTDDEFAADQGADLAPCRPGRLGALARDRARLAEPDQRDVEAGGRVGRGTAKSGCTGEV